MSKRKLDESSPSSSSETQVNTRIIPLDISNSDRQVWLVKVPVRTQKKLKFICEGGVM